VSTSQLWILATLLFAGGSRFRHRTTRQVLMVAACYIYYFSWSHWLLSVLVGSTLVNFGATWLVRRYHAAWTIWAAVIVNVLLLAAFRHLPLPMAAPIGISFWTFQALSYAMDVYREDDVQPTVLEFALYLGFWPTVLMGPVCRIGTMLPQFRSRSTVTWSGVANGVYRIALGAFMKLACADVLASGWRGETGIAAAFDGHLPLGAPDVWLVAVGFGIQLFLDFAGYSHIVIGAAEIAGYRIDENFDRPWLSTSPTDFWHRWHMSLSSWIRDYVFLPLATQRRSGWWRYAALCASMVLFGFWHGAQATFIVWGAYQGALLVGHRLGQAWMRGRGTASQAMTAASWALTLALMSMGWLLFRSSTLAQAAGMFRTLLMPSAYGVRLLPDSLYVLVGALAAGVLLAQGAATRAARRQRVARASDGSASLTWADRRWVLAPMLAACLLYAYLFEVVGGSAPGFVYRLF